jgi:hypothetical protein
MYALAGTYAAARDLQAVNDSEQKKNIDTTRDANVMCRPLQDRILPHKTESPRFCKCH